MKYVHVCAGKSQAVLDAQKEVPRRGGMYNNLRMFDGEIKAYDEIDDFSQYDVVQVNMSPVDQNLIQDIRRRLGPSSNTMLVLNNDYVAETWDGFQMHPRVYEANMRCADMLFSTEPYQVSNMLPGTFVLPHPHMIKTLKHMKTPETQDVMGLFFHWWEGKTNHAEKVLRWLKESGFNIKSKVFAYKADRDTDKRWGATYFDDYLPMMTYPDFIQEVLRCKLCYDFTGYHTYGRNSVDNAALGIPTIGTDRVESMRRCFPNLICDPFNIKGTFDIAKRVLTDDKWRQEQIDYAKQASEFYNYKNSKARFLAALKIAKFNGGNLFYKNVRWNSKGMAIPKDLEFDKSILLEERWKEEKEWRKQREGI